jgi:hypothetical protein
VLGCTSWQSLACACGNGHRMKVTRGRHLSLATICATLARGEATNSPCGEEKGHVPTHGIAELGGTMREARQCMCTGGAAWLVAEPSAPFIRDGAAMAGGKWRFCIAQWREATTRCMRDKAAAVACAGYAGSSAVVAGASATGWVMAAMDRQWAPATHEGDLGEKILTCGARVEGGVADRLATRAPGPTGSGAWRWERHEPASCGGLGRRGEFGPRRRNSFSFSN